MQTGSQHGRADIDADHGGRNVEFLRHGVLLVLSAPLPASRAGRARARPDHPINGNHKGTITARAPTRRLGDDDVSSRVALWFNINSTGRCALELGIEPVVRYRRRMASLLTRAEPR